MERWAELSALMSGVVCILEDRHPGCMTETDASSEDDDEDEEPTPAGAVAYIRAGPWRHELDDDELYPELQLWLLDGEGWLATIYDEAEEGEIEVPMDFAVESDVTRVAEYLIDVLEGRVPLEAPGAE